MSNWNSRSSYIQQLVQDWCILSCFFFTPLFLLVSILSIVTNTFSADLFDYGVGRITPGTFGAADTYPCFGHSWYSIPLSCCIYYSTAATQSTSLSFDLSRSLFQFSQSSVSEMLCGVLSLWLSTAWWLIVQIWQTFNIWVHDPERSFADKAGGKGDLSGNLNAAALSGWKSH
jgi:hypothetical protein